MLGNRPRAAAPQGTAGGLAAVMYLWVHEDHSTHKDSGSSGSRYSHSLAGTIVSSGAVRKRRIYTERNNRQPGLSLSSRSRKRRGERTRSIDGRKLCPF